MMLMVVVLSLGSAAGLGVLTWVLWRSFQKQELPLRILTGVVMAITGLAALLSGLCGVWVIGS